MILRPVLITIPPKEGLTGRERIQRQREFARTALRECAVKSGVEPWDWAADEDRIPIPHGKFHWSISHKPGMAAAVIANQPVGIDVEFITPRGDGLFDKLGHDVEWDMLGGRTWPAFFRLWTAKEATLKAHGVGIAGFLSCRLASCPDDIHLVMEYRGRAWPVEHYHCKDHLAAVTTLGCEVAWTRVA